MHADNRRTPDPDGVAKPKQAGGKRVLALPQLISEEEGVESAIDQLPEDAMEWLADAVTHPDLSIEGKRVLLKELFMLAATNKLNSDACRLLLRLQLSQSREKRTEVPDSISVPPLSASSQPEFSAGLVAPLPSNWAAVRAPNGHAYYFHKVTM